ncbi:hypothetical protein ACO2Q9_08935 [Variovorax sp. VNK109]|jgi:hypothetical protein|uniref:hypothetical protein n=1 Tax=Variovorax sp. VNK109 TaxID=3400919 RepID=UPI003BFFFF50
MLAGTIVAYNPQTGRAAAQVERDYTVFEILDDWQPKIGSKVWGDDLHNRFEGSLRTESQGMTRILVIELYCTTPRVRTLLEKPEPDF